MNAAICSVLLNVKQITDISLQMLQPIQKLHSKAIATLKPLDISKHKLRAYREMDDVIWNYKRSTSNKLELTGNK